MSKMGEKSLVDIEGQPVSPVLAEKEEFTPAWKDRTPQKRISRQSYITLQWILLNIVSTVALVFMNKMVFTDSQLRKCQMTIAAWHFITTAIVLYLATLCDMFVAVRVAVVTMLPVACFFAGFLILGNLSLTFNSMGFYQLAKVMTTPTVVLLNFVLFGITITRWCFLAVVSVCAGVLLVLTTGAADNVLGAMIAVAAFTVTALYQIWIGKKMSDLKISGSQLLLNQAPVGAAILLVLAPFVDTMPDLSMVPLNTIWILGSSGILASLLNLSQFLIIERSSALTFNIMSQVKTIIIVSMSWYMEGRSLIMTDILGIALTLSGAYAYSNLSGKKPPNNSPAKSDAAVLPR